MERTETKRAWKKKAYEKLEVERRIRQIIETEIDRNRVTAIAMPAGAGKSAYIKRLIANSDDGLIVVTDRIKQIKNYFTYTDENGESSEFDLENAIYLTSENLADAMAMINYKPIIVMTMARYFSLSTKEIIALSRWKNGKRTKVIIDEMPPLIQQEQITMKDLNDAHSALFEAIDDTSNQTEKDWAIGQWKKFRDRIEAQMNQLEKAYSENHDQFYTWFDLEGGDITDDDNRFASFINANEKKLSKYGLSRNVDVIAGINHVMQLRDFGGVYSCRLKRSGEYVKSLTVVINNLDRLIHLVDKESGDGLKVYVLDGTADLSPDYRQKGIDIIDCTEYYRDLSNLTINIIDINTSKNAMNSKDYAPKLEEIKKYIQPNSLIITYKDYEKMFADFEPDHKIQIAHFGAVRGDNDFNQTTNMIQIGLNRYPPLYYLLIHRELHKDFYDAKFDKPMDEYIDELDRIVKNHCLKSDNEAIKIASQEIHTIMEMSLLSDIEQNLFRTAIRNYNNKQPISCTLFFDVKQHTELINQMRKRFETHGAKVIVHEVPQSLKLESTKNRKAPNGQQKTNAQKIFDYIHALDAGVVFKISDMLKTIGISNSQLKDAKKGNQALTKMLNKMQTKTKGYYQKAD